MRPPLKHDVGPVVRVVRRCDERDGTAFWRGKGGLA
jgi:hypothetical protein